MSDPLLSAGFVRCGVCGRAAYPIDAAWAGDLLLASYPAPCEHTQPQAWLIDPGQLTANPDWCNGQTVTTGSPCRNRPRADSPFCWQHDPARRAA
jgi:hypothetical protein